MSNKDIAQESKVIRTEDEDGNIHDFELIDIIEVDDKEYGILTLANQEIEDLEEEQEAVIMKLSKEEGKYVFEVIESEEEFNQVVEVLESEAQEVE